MFPVNFNAFVVLFDIGLIRLHLLFQFSCETDNENTGFMLVETVESDEENAAILDLLHLVKKP
jgi:hypothetical protein